MHKVYTMPKIANSNIVILQDIQGLSLRLKVFNPNLHSLPYLSAQTMQD